MKNIINKKNLILFLVFIGGVLLFEIYSRQEREHHLRAIAVLEQTDTLKREFGQNFELRKLRRETSLFEPLSGDRSGTLLYRVIGSPFYEKIMVEWRYIKSQNSWEISRIYHSRKKKELISQPIPATDEMVKSYLKMVHDED